MCNIMYDRMYKKGVSGEIRDYQINSEFAPSNKIKHVDDSVIISEIKNFYQEHKDFIVCKQIIDIGSRDYSTDLLRYDLLDVLYTRVYDKRCIVFLNSVNFTIQGEEAFKKNKCTRKCGRSDGRVDKCSERGRTPKKSSEPYLPIVGKTDSLPFGYKPISLAQWAINFEYWLHII